MIRRQARERREYLYRRAATLKAAETSAKRAALKASLASGKPLADSRILNDNELRKDYKFDESQPNLPLHESLSLDDEYAHLSGLVDPRVLVTTSRSPSSRLSTVRPIEFLLS